MSTENHENGSNGSENDPWDPAALRRLAPGTLGSEGTRALVCAIRNPDATTGQVAEKCGLTSSYTVENALRSAVQDADRDEVNHGQALERRGEARDAETYIELTDKQQAIIDFAAENPTFTEDRTWADVAQAIQEQEGTVVNETYVGQVLRKYPEILHVQRALAASDGEAEVELEAALSDMTMRQVLEAAGYDLPDENQDSMPEASVDSEDATLGDSREAGAEFQTGSEVAEQQEQEDEDEQDEGGTTFLDEGWVAAHSDVPGASQAQRLPDEAEDEDVKQNTPYWAYVNGTAPYGVFVSLTNPAYGDDVSGLVADERLYGKKGSLERGDALVVELDHRNAKGLAFTDWRLLHPDETQAQEATDEADSEAGGDGGEGTEDEDGEQEQPDSEDDALLAVQPDSEVLAALDERVAQQAQQMEVLANRIDTLREDAVFASEVGEFADEVEQRLDDLRDAVEDVPEKDEGARRRLGSLDERLERVEEAQSGTVEDALEAAEATSEQAHQAEQKVQALQEMVNGLAEQVQQATSTDGPLGRVQEDVQRLAGEDATVNNYTFERHGRNAAITLKATLPPEDGEQGEQEQEDEDAPECYECGHTLGETWRDANEVAKQHGRHPAACPQCGQNPLPPVGGEQEDTTDE